MEKQSVENEAEDDISDFYFESDHLALKGNKDYLTLLKTIATLEAQRMKAVQDVDDLLTAQENALQDPIKFVEKLQRGESLDVSAPQIIAEVPNIDWSQYNVPLPADSSRPLTRKALYRSSENSKSDQEFDAKNKVLVRGRIFDDSKPETFNQLWTVEEQRRLEELLTEFPPEEVEMKRWKKIADALGNRTAKQVSSRVQKYFIKLKKAGLPVPGRAPKAQLPDIWKKGFHRHQKNNRYLFKPTTFFPMQDVPVYMSDFDDDGFGNYLSISTTSCETNIKEENDFSDEEYSNIPEKIQTTLQLNLLRRVKNDKDRNGGNSHVEHLGYKCDFCKEEPLVGTRWHCADCPSNASIDFCTDCVVTMLYSDNPHPLTHNLMAISGTREGVWDQDYTLQSFTSTGGTFSYNYLDPNFMPD